jgi:hypothetical protein
VLEKEVLEKEVLEVVQSHQESERQSGPPGVHGIEGTKLALAAITINGVRKLEQRVLVVQLLIQTRPEEIMLLLWRGLNRLHQITRFCRIYSTFPLFYNPCQSLGAQ